MVADALSRKGLLLTMVQSEITCFDTLKDQYEFDDDCGDIWNECVNREYLEYKQGFFSKETCVSPKQP